MSTAMHKMSVPSTISCFDNFKVLLFFLGLYRYHLNHTSRHKIIAFLTFILMKTIYIIMIFYANFHTYNDANIQITVTLFQFCVTAEWLYLIIFPSWSKKLFDALEKLDSKCGFDDEYFRQVTRRTNVVFYASLCSVVLDNLVVYLFVPNVSFGMFIVCLGAAAHETELLFYGLLLQCVNGRQARLAGLPVQRGMRVHRYLLVASEHLNGCFNVEAFVLLTGALVTTFIYIVQIFIADPSIMLRLALFLGWRELKSLYCVWYVCVVAADGETNCRELAFHVARRAADHSKDGVSNPEEYELLRRWHRYLVSKRGRPSAGDCITFELNVPLQLLQVSATYLIIFVQIYRAY